jgi:hypothetical protein
MLRGGYHARARPSREAQPLGSRGHLRGATLEDTKGKGHEEVRQNSIWSSTNTLFCELFAVLLEQSAVTERRARATAATALPSCSWCASWASCHVCVVWIRPAGVRAPVTARGPSRRWPAPSLWRRRPPGLRTLAFGPGSAQLAGHHHRHLQAHAHRRQHLAPVGNQLFVGGPAGAPGTSGAGARRSGGTGCRARAPARSLPASLCSARSAPSHSHAGCLPDCWGAVLDAGGEHEKRGWRGRVGGPYSTGMQTRGSGGWRRAEGSRLTD